LDSHHFQEITCPDTGRQITVARRLDPVGRLYATNQITNIQHQAAINYQSDLEASSLRAPSRGPSDLSWRGRRPSDNGKPARRLQRAAKALAPDQAAVIQSALAGQRTDTRKLHQALNNLAVAYGLATPTRH
jgi:hypothetical protein